MEPRPLHYAVGAVTTTGPIAPRSTTCRFLAWAADFQHDVLICGMGCTLDCSGSGLKDGRHLLCRHPRPRLLLVLALRLRSELESRLAARGESFEWASIVRDLDRVEEIEVEQQGTRFLLRTDTPGSAGKVFQAAGVALPPTLREVS